MRIPLLIIFIVFIVLGFPPAYSATEAEATASVDLSTSNLPSGQWDLVWNDEFSGDALDLSKWDFRLHRLGKRVPHWTTEAARLNGKGQLELHAIMKDGKYFCSGLQTGANFLDKPGAIAFGGKAVWPIGKLEPPKFEHRYGYWEVRCQLQTQPGWWSAFWIQSSVIGSSLDPGRSGVEIDVMENFTRDGKVSHNLHWGGYGENYHYQGSGDLPITGLDRGFHTYGVLWTVDELVFYVDGQESWRSNKAVPQCPEFALITTEIAGAEGSLQDGNDIAKAVLPDAFVIDHFRVFMPKAAD